MYDTSLKNVSGHLWKKGDQDVPVNATFFSGEWINLNVCEFEAGKKKARSSEAQKRKLLDGDTYDPSSPTSENSCDESPAAKRAAVNNASGGIQAKPVVKARKSLPELEKYWKAVKEDPSDFTGWTYLLQYVDQEVRTCLYFVYFRYHVCSFEVVSPCLLPAVFVYV